MPKLVSRTLLATLCSVALTFVGRADILLFDGTLEYVIPATEGFVPGGVVLALPVSGTALVNQSQASVHLATLSFQTAPVGPAFGFGTLPGATQTGLTISLPGPTPTSLMGFLTQISGGGPGAFLTRVITPTNMMAATLTFGGIGTLSLPGSLRLCLLGGCGGPLGVTMPLGVVGLGASTTSMGFVAGTHRLHGGLWTVGTAWVIATDQGVPDLLTSMGGSAATQTLEGFAHGPQSATSSTAQPSGVVQFVVPSIVASDLNLVPPFALFGRLTLHFTPEPGAALMLGAGGGLVALLGVLRHRGRVR